MAKGIKFKGYLHGGDYNPEQWLNSPQILEKDIELFKKAGINEVTMGVFSWAVLEPREGEYDQRHIGQHPDKSQIRREGFQHIGSGI